MVDTKQPTAVDAVLPEYMALHESTGESYKSMADRVEAQGGSESLVNRLRSLDDDSEAFKANAAINRRAAAEAKNDDDPVHPEKRTPPRKQTT